MMALLLGKEPSTFSTIYNYQRQGVSFNIALCKVVIYFTTDIFLVVCSAQTSAKSEFLKVSSGKQRSFGFYFHCYLVMFCSKASPLDHTRTYSYVVLGYV